MISILWSRVRRILPVVFAIVLVGQGASDASAATRRFVDDDHAQCPAAGFTSIQAAVNASAAGDAVVVCNGVYNESVTVGPGKDHLQLSSHVTHGATITTTPASDPRALVRVTGAQDVSVLKFKLIGAGDTHACGRLHGVLVDGNSNALIQDNLIEQIANTPTSSCLQSLIQPAAVGIGVEDPARARINHNVVDGVLGPTGDSGAYAPNTYGAVGVQVAGPTGSQAFATITNNDITMSGVGQGVYFASSNGVVSDNRISDAQDAVRGEGGGGKTVIRHNVLTDSLGSGIVFANEWHGSGDLVFDNRITGSGAAGIRLRSCNPGQQPGTCGFGFISGVVIRRNLVRFNSSGIELVHWTYPSTIDNVVAGNDARFNDVRDCFEGRYVNDTPTTLSEGLFNTWYQNRGKKNVQPPGICR